MNANSIRDLLKRQPFVPFEVHMSSGDVYRVTHPENVLLAGSNLIIYYPETDHTAWLSMLHLTGVQTQPAAAK